MANAYILQSLSETGVLDKIKNYATSQGLTLSEIYTAESKPSHITSHHFVSTVNKHMAESSNAVKEIIVYNVHEIADDMTEFFKVLANIGGEKITIHFIHLGCVIQLNQSQDEGHLELISALSQIHAEYQSSESRVREKRTSNRGLILGRPTGKKNTKYKLDMHRDEIQKYLNFGISVASMAKLLDCHPQTVKRYIIERGMTKQEGEA